jgi:DNA mismatch repair protein MutL
MPARLKFLKQPLTETGHIHTVITRYALANPKIHFTLTADARPIFQSSGSGKLYDVLIAVYGLDVAEKTLEISSAPAYGVAEDIGEEPSAPLPCRVHGYTSMPSLHRANRAYITFFVNRRWIQDHSLAHAVAQAYHTLLPVGRHPLAVLLLEMDPAEVDVNVHPTKREVKFRSSQSVFSAVQSAVRHTLVERSPVPILAHSPRAWPAPDWERRRARRA